MRLTRKLTVGDAGVSNGIEGEGEFILIWFGNRHGVNSFSGQSPCLGLVELVGTV